MSQDPRIVVVEDNPADVALLRRALDEQQQSYEYIVLNDGEQALRFIEQLRLETEPLPCVILLDLHLPRVDGNVVLRQIMAEPIMTHVQVAVWTTLASPEERAEALRCGAAHYQHKPNGIEGFWELARKLLELCNSRTATAVP